MSGLEENYGRFDIPQNAPQINATVFSPETEKRIAVYAVRREKQIVEIKRLWTYLCRLRGLKATTSALNDKINDWFQVGDGLDALDGQSTEKMKESLEKSIEKEERK